MINGIMHAIIDLAQGTNPFAQILRGPLPAAPSISMEPGPSLPVHHMNRGMEIALPITINLKHPEMAVAADTAWNVVRSLCTQDSYPSGEGWQIASIWCDATPRLIGREHDNTWLYAASVTASIYIK